MTSNNKGQPGKHPREPELYDLSQVTSDEMFELLDNVNIGPDTDIEDGLEDDFDDDDSLADPDFCLEDEINQCNDLTSESSTPDNQLLTLDIETPDTSQPSTSGNYSTESQKNSVVARVLSPLTSGEPSTSFQRQQKRPRSPLPEFEDGPDVSEPNTGGFTGNPSALLTQSKECKEIIWRKQHLQLYKNEVVFRGSTELPLHFQDLKTPYQAYFFTQEFLENIAEQTNLYARQYDIKTTFVTNAAEIRKYIVMSFIHNKALH
ncbi:uncharacterized protein LOC126744699 [Anthonomus grandis grandis]|uniref:uncharacterized protein LOC126744699 n=1 Tax=Anthonomus grandis grandis TaxID=2921223 RepID=UPI002166A43E|nr:uncharacterized protein LOC126744699 [Anthonomus grandis grandis]